MQYVLTWTRQYDEVHSTEAFTKTEATYVATAMLQLRVTPTEAAPVTSKRGRRQQESAVPGEEQGSIGQRKHRPSEPGQTSHQRGLHPLRRARQAPPRQGQRQLCLPPWPHPQRTVDNGARRARPLRESREGGPF